MKRLTTADEAAMFAKVIAAQLHAPRTVKTAELHGSDPITGITHTHAHSHTHRDMRPLTAHSTTRDDGLAAGVATARHDRGQHPAAAWPSPASTPRHLRVTAMHTSAVAFDGYPDADAVNGKDRMDPVEAAKRSALEVRRASGAAVDVRADRRINAQKNMRSQVIIAGPDDASLLTAEVYRPRVDAHVDGAPFSPSHGRTVSASSPIDTRRRPASAMSAARGRRHLESQITLREDAAPAPPPVRVSPVRTGSPVHYRAAYEDGAALARARKMDVLHTHFSLSPEKE